MTSVDGSKWLYDVHCYPKNQTAYGGVTLQKVDSVTKKPLKGATFTLYSSEDGKTYTEYMTGLKTGDNGTIWGYVLLLVSSMMCFVILFYQNQKRRKGEIQDEAE